MIMNRRLGLCLGLCIGFSLMNGPFLFAVEGDAEKIKGLQEEQQQLVQEYETNKKALQTQLSGQLEELDENSPEDKAKRIALMKEMQGRQLELRQTFETKLKDAQRQERKLRTGREELNDLPAYTEATKKYYDELQEQKERRAMLERAQKFEKPASGSAAAGAVVDTTHSLPEISTRNTGVEAPVTASITTHEETVKQKYPNRVDLKSLIQNSYGNLGQR